MMLRTSVAPCYSESMSETTNIKFSAAYLNDFSALVNFSEIVEQAVYDQSVGIPANTGRYRYETVIERSHYLNSWGYSIAANGPGKVSLRTAQDVEDMARLSAISAAVISRSIA